MTADRIEMATLRDRAWSRLLKWAIETDCGTAETPEQIAPVKPGAVSSGSDQSGRVRVTRTVPSGGTR